MQRTYKTKNMMLTYLDISAQTLMKEMGSQKNPIYNAAITMTLKNHPPSWIIEAQSFLGKIRRRMRQWNRTNANVILRTAETPKQAVA